MTMQFSRHWGMPSADTFDCEPIKGFVQKYLMRSKVSVDPFARNRDWFTHTNDIDPDTRSQYHYDARDFLGVIKAKEVKPDLVIFDPPYSPRQISECYKRIGKAPGIEETQNARLYKEVRDKIRDITQEGSIVLSFGWNSHGMGKGWKMLEIMLVCHGGGHNDTICLAEERLAVLQRQLLPTEQDLHNAQAMIHSMTK